jgi:hypothetical protein
MRFDILRKQVTKLKAQMPKEIVIRLRDGTEFRHPGPVIDFVVQGLREGHLGDGPIWSACRNSDQISISQDPLTRDQLVALIRCAGHSVGAAKDICTPAGDAAVGAAPPNAGITAGAPPAASAAPHSQITGNSEAIEADSQLPGC